MTIPIPTARFTVRGNRLEVDGHLDAGAAVGLWAVAEFFVGDPQVTIDLSRCVYIDADGHAALARAEARIRAAGGEVAVLCAAGLS